MKTRMPRRTKGFTLVEVLIVMAMLGILAGLALPNLVPAVYKADATYVVTDMRTVRLAAMQYLSTTGVLPAPTTWGTVPPELEPYLPENFDFQYKDVEYAWSILGLGAPGAASNDGWVELVQAYSVVPMEMAQGGGAATGSVGVFWVRYSADSAIGQSLQDHIGVSAFWTPTQMMFLVAG